MATALTFPLSLAQFFAMLPIAPITLDLEENQYHSETGGGEILTADAGPRLWTGTVQLNRRSHAQARLFEARARMLRQAGRSFFVTDYRNAYPSGDPDGSILGAASPTISAIDGDSRRLSLQGLPAGYTLTAGDQLSFAYGSNPTRYALHDVVSDTEAADGSGNLSLLELSPFIRPGAVAGTAVTLIKPFCKAVMVPGSFRPSTGARVVSEAMQFTFKQTLR